ncbi:hypothetical protein ACFE04_005134 [Oxalis oulophora]
MSNIGTSKGILELFKFGVYVSVPILLMYTSANNSNNLHKFMANRSYVVYPEHTEPILTNEEVREGARELARKHNIRSAMGLSLKESNVDGFVQDMLADGKPWSSGELSNIGGSFVFVFAHVSCDKRCGVYMCGPELIKRLQEEIDLRGLGSEVFVSPCSHVGGHKYGYVTPDDVPELLDNHIA